MQVVFISVELVCKKRGWDVSGMEWGVTFICIPSGRALTSSPALALGTCSRYRGKAGNSSSTL